VVVLVVGGVEPWALKAIQKALAGLMIASVCERGLGICE
jgi:hypothetical protein